MKDAPAGSVHQKERKTVEEVEITRDQMIELFDGKQMDSWDEAEAVLNQDSVSEKVYMQNG